MSSSTTSYDRDTGRETWECDGIVESTIPDRDGGYIFTDSRHPGATITNSDGYSYYNPSADNPYY